MFNANNEQLGCQATCSQLKTCTLLTLTFLFPLHGDAVAVFTSPHDLRRRESLRFTCQRDVLVLPDCHCGLRALRVQNIRWHYNTHQSPYYLPLTSTSLTPNRTRHTRYIQKGRRFLKFARCICMIIRLVHLSLTTVSI